MSSPGEPLESALTKKRSLPFTKLDRPSTLTTLFKAERSMHALPAGAVGSAAVPVQAASASVVAVAPSGAKLT